MNDSEISENFQQPLPVSFKVIGIGSGTTDIMEKVKSYGYDCVGCILAETPSDCIPMDDDRMVIIVAHDNEEVANAIAKTYHDAGVLTIGLVPDADYSCYDSVATETGFADFPEIIKNLLQPMVSYGYISYDFNDQCTVLKNSHSFNTLTTYGRSVEEAVASMQDKLENVALKDIESLSSHIYFKRERRANIKMEDMAHLSKMISCLPESINVIWSVNFDDTLPDDLIKFTVIMSGKELSVIERFKKVTTANANNPLFAPVDDEYLGYREN